jgi:hypothetical protein
MTRELPLEDLGSQDEADMEGVERLKHMDSKPDKHPNSSQRRAWTAGT